MNNKDLQTFLLWMDKVGGRHVGIQQFFAVAHYWKYKKQNQTQLDFCVAHYKRTGKIPEFVREFWQKQVIPATLLKGGKK